jgi:hypothetical protein
MKLNKKLKLNIRSKEWTMVLMDVDSYHKKNGEDSRAITHIEEHEVYFNTDYLTLPIIRHEITHVFVESYSHYNVEYTNDQLEEVLCSIVEYYYHELDKISRQIYKHFKKYIKKRSK